jgi:hypothetical protein
VSSCIKITPVVDVVDIVCLLLRVTQHRSVALTPILRKNRSLAKCVIFYGVGSWGVHPNLKATAHRMDDENSKIASLRRCGTRPGSALSGRGYVSFIYICREREPTPRRPYAKEQHTRQEASTRSFSTATYLRYLKYCKI